MEEKDNNEYFFDNLNVRTQELILKGFDFSRAHKVAWLEHRIKIWKEKWGDNFWVLIYGDFNPPQNDYIFKDLGITVLSEKVENSVVNDLSLTVLKAKVEINELSIDSLKDAIKRINIFLGSWVLVTRGNASCRWWSWLTHDSGGGTIESLIHKDLENAIAGVTKLSPNIRKKVDAALYWIRDPKNLLYEHARIDLLRIYVSYWNAFECLVEAVNLLVPLKKLSKSKKQAIIDDYLSSHEGNVDSKAIDELYKNVVNSGFKAKAINALNVCFKEIAHVHIDECFNQEKKEDCLYQIRNSINHGDIDAEDLDELIRIDSRLSKLWIIVWGIFGRLIPFPTPGVSKANQPNAAE